MPPPALRDRAVSCSARCALDLRRMSSLRRGFSSRRCRGGASVPMQCTKPSGVAEIATMSSAPPCTRSASHGTCGNLCPIASPCHMLPLTHGRGSTNIGVEKPVEPSSCARLHRSSAGGCHARDGGRWARRSTSGRSAPKAGRPGGGKCARSTRLPFRAFHAISCHGLRCCVHC